MLHARPLAAIQYRHMTHLLKLETPRYEQRSSPFET
jgi:hypothetical protein